MTITIPEYIYKQDITMLKLENRAEHVLKRAGFNTIEDVLNNANSSEKLMKKCRGCGQKTAKEIVAKIYALYAETDLEGGNEQC